MGQLTVNGVPWGEYEKWGRITLTDLDLPNKVMLILESHNINNAQELIRYTADQLLSLKDDTGHQQIGQATLGRIRGALSNKSLNLKGE